MKNIRILQCAIITVSIFCTGTQSRAIEALSPEQKVLERELGNWVNTWTVNQTEASITGTDKWVLDGRFIQGEYKASNGTTSLRLDTYDTERKCYRRWLFRSDGQITEYVGNWAAETKTMTWSFSMGDDLRGTQTEHYIDNDTRVFSAIIKSPDGKVYYHATGKCVRQKDNKEEK